MPDITELLSTAATPGAPLDLAGLDARRRRLVRRRRAAYAGGVVSAAGALAAIVVLSPLGGNAADRLRVPPASGGTPGAAASASPGAGRPAPEHLMVRPHHLRPLGVIHGPSAVRAHRGHDRAHPAGVHPGGTATHSGRRPPHPSSPNAPSSTGGGAGGNGSSAYPRLASCTVDAPTVPGQAASCQFTATTAGGFRVAARGGVGVGIDAGPQFEVRVRHLGAWVYYPRRTSQYCGKGIIAPGDRVVVTATQARSSAYAFSVSAGRGFDCG